MHWSSTESSGYRERALVQRKLLRVHGYAATWALACLNDLQVAQVQIMTEDELAVAERASFVLVQGYRHHTLWFSFIALLGHGRVG